MESEKNTGDLSRSSCCGGSQEATDQGCGCGCDAGPARRGWIRTLIFAVVMLAAFAVGAFALKAKSRAVPPAGQDCSSECGSNCCDK